MFENRGGFIMNKYLDLKFMLLGIGIILTATPLSLYGEFGLAMAAVVIGLFFVIIGFAYKQAQTDDKGSVANNP